MTRVLVLLAVLAGCGDNLDGNVTIVAPSGSPWTAALRELALYTPDSRVAVDERDAAPTADAAGTQIAVVDDAALATESYRLEAPAGTTRTWLVHAHDILGAQYGVTAALEYLGFRYRHPYDPTVPVTPAPSGALDTAVHAPQIRVRGLHVHTLHPIESLFAFWAGQSDDAHRIIDWVIKNRGNFLQWAALEDIQDPTRWADWQTTTRELIDYAHSRGVRVGINIQLFAQSSLQQALTLVQSTTAPAADQIAKNLPLVTNGLPFDVVNLSFGEFFDADPQAFIDAVNEMVAQLAVLAPNAEVHANVHDGATQLVTYMGMTFIYYFLVKYVDPSVIPDIHTTFYYNLFEDAGGAYQMQDFSPHRQYLLDKMCANQKAAYFPEDAYWIAFDDSIPLFLPIYVRSRLFDLQQLKLAAPPPCSPLDEHLIFSSGWEWNYWLHDVTSLRASYELPDSQASLIEEQLGPQLGQLVSDLADIQHDALIGQRLAPYLASRDALIDGGRMLGIISQPDRTTFDDLVAATDDARAAFVTNVMDPLGDLATAFDGIEARYAKLGQPDDRWTREVGDGIAVDRLRAHFIIAAYQATLDHLAGNDAAAASERAEAATLLSEATAYVQARHADLHDANPQILVKAFNATVYSYGYLYMADQLCFWNRELTQVDNILNNASTVPASCDY